MSKILILSIALIGLVSSADLIAWKVSSSPLDNPYIKITYEYETNAGWSTLY